MQEKLLIVDDETDILNMLEDYFTRNGYQVMTAESGTEAIRKVGGNPDMILLDINLPDMDGLAVCRKIRDTTSCPILFSSIRAKFAKAGCKPYIQTVWGSGYRWGN